MQLREKVNDAREALVGDKFQASTFSFLRCRHKGSLTEDSDTHGLVCPEAPAETGVTAIPCYVSVKVERSCDISSSLHEKIADRAQCGLSSKGSRPMLRDSSLHTLGIVEQRTERR
jgi:hypothetical protein